MRAILIQNLMQKIIQIQIQISTSESWNSAKRKRKYISHIIKIKSAATVIKKITKSCIANWKTEKLNSTNERNSMNKRSVITKKLMRSRIKQKTRWKKWWENHLFQQFQQKFKCKNIEYFISDFKCLNNWFRLIYKQQIFISFNLQLQYFHDFSAAIWIWDFRECQEQFYNIYKNKDNQITD